MTVRLNININDECAAFIRASDLSATEYIRRAISLYAQVDAATPGPVEPTLADNPHEFSIIIPATGNEIDRRDHTFLQVSLGDGNLDDLAEVHLQITSVDGQFSQGWFPIGALRKALRGIA